MLEAPRCAPHHRWRSTLALTFTGLGFSGTLIAFLPPFFFAPVYRDGALPGGFQALSQLEMSRLYGCKVGFGSGLRPLVFFRWGV